MQSMEIELKARVRSLATLRRALRQLHARRSSSIHQVDTYYSPERRPLDKRKGYVLRVRAEPGKRPGRFELHIPKNAYAAEELELTVDDVRLLQKLLHLLRFRREFVIDKQRETYRLGRVTIALDVVRGLGTFVEVEILGADTAANRAKLRRVLAQLGVREPDMCYNLHYHQMALQKQKRNPARAYF